MKLRNILALLALTIVGPALAQPRDALVLEAQLAARQGDKAKLAQLLPAVRGHALEPWVAYWELKARLETASAAEVQEFLTRYAGSYHEDRLRNDWLLLLGQRRDWAGFAREHSHYRMNDDREVRCYALLVDYLQQGAAAAPALAEEVRKRWLAQREADDGCTTAASRMTDDPQVPAKARLSAADAWRKARQAMESNRLRAVVGAVEIVAPEVLPQLNELHADPTRFLSRRITAPARVRGELISLALIKLAATAPQEAAEQLTDKWASALRPETRDWTWGAIGKQAALRLLPEAEAYFSKVGAIDHLSDDLLGWRLRAALRANPAPHWTAVLQAVDAMSTEASAEVAWVYWKARALATMSEAQRTSAQQLLQSIASPRGFYEMLALEELGQRITVPPAPTPLTTAEKEVARLNPGLNRAVYAITLGLRSEGVREWNYSTNLHTPGGMGERELLAAAQFACEREVWDRCINTSERTRGAFDAVQRFPMPFRDAVVKRSREIGLDAAYVYGLIRQESRFIMDARSHVGAAGLMQVMPATARWTAKRMGLADFKTEQLGDHETNIAIGTAYLKLVLNDFAGSMPLAAAAYNAGPSRSRAWRNGPLLEAAIWAENIPFAETRDYVKKVLSNTTLYAAVLSGKPQSIKDRLGTVGPREVTQPEPDKELP